MSRCLDVFEFQVPGFEVCICEVFDVVWDVFFDFFREVCGVFFGDLFREVFRDVCGFFFDVVCGLRVWMSSRFPGFQVCEVFWDVVCDFSCEVSEVFFDVVCEVSRVPGFDVFEVFDVFLQ